MEAAVPFLPDFGPAYMSELLWSLAILGHKPGEGFILVRMDMELIGWGWAKSNHHTMPSGPESPAETISPILSR